MSKPEPKTEPKPKSEPKSKPKSIRIYNKEYDSLLKYPFKSKYKYIDSCLQPLYDTNIKTEPFIPDYKLKSCKKMSKPNFSNEPGCWEMDLMFANYYNTGLTKSKQTYIVLINVNTRYLIVEPIKSKERNDVGEGLKKIVNEYSSMRITGKVGPGSLKHDDSLPRCEFKTFKCDGESSFVSLAGKTDSPDEVSNRCIVIIYDNGFRDLISNLDDLIFNYERNNVLRKVYFDEIVKYHNIETLKRIYSHSYTYASIIGLVDFYIINFVINDSDYALSHKTVDSVIRTLRNAFGLDDRRIADPYLMKQMVEYYNNTPHSSLRFKNYMFNYDEYDSNLERPKQYIYYTPTQMQSNRELEWRYIRKMKLKLREINKNQFHKGLLSYKPWNIILVHLDKGKTQKKHEKRRRVFNEIAEFISYSNGNVICRLINPYHTYSKTSDGKLIPYTQPKRGPKIKSDDERATIEVPIIYTKFVCDKLKDLNDDFRNYFVINGLQ